MPALTTDQLYQLRGRGYSESQITQIYDAPDTTSVWGLLDQFESDKIFHAGQTGFNTDQVNWIRALPAEQQWSAMQEFQNQNLWNLRSLGMTDDQMKWYAALPDDSARWQFISQIQASTTPVSPGVPGMPPFGTNNPSVPMPHLPGWPGTDTGALDASAKAIINGFLQQYGLGGLADWAWNAYKNGAPIEQIMLEMRTRPEYKARFPAMEALAKQGRAISENQYIEYERSAIGIMRAAGLPNGFYDQPGDFTKFLSQNVSVAELQERVQTYLSVALDADPKGEMQRLYGVGPGELAAYYMDPDKALPLIERQANAALIGVRSNNTGFGNLTAGEAENLVGLNVSPDQAQQGFAQLAHLQEVFKPLEGGEQSIGRGSQMGAAFEGNAAAQGAIEQQQRRRVAHFEQGGEFATGESGFGGIGTAR